MEEGLQNAIGKYDTRTNYKPDRDYDQFLDTTRHLANTFGAYLLKNAPDANQTTRAEVTDASTALKELLGDHEGALVAQDVYDEVSAVYEKALGIKSPKRG